MYLKVLHGASGGASPPDQASSTITCNDQPMIREHMKRSLPQHVYDLYYINNPEFDFGAMDHVSSIEAYHHDMMSSDQGREAEGYEEIYDDEDDSNDEDNWRNDYPDEDPYLYENGYDDGKVQIKCSFRDKKCFLSV